jgi:undecaprenyl-diphosphatase
MEPRNLSPDHRRPTVDPVDGNGHGQAGYPADRPDADAPDAPSGPVGTAVVGLLLGLMVIAAVVAGLGASDRRDESDLRAPDAVLLGLVEGVTEWLPISSTGHLTVTQELLGIDGDAADSYAIAIQAGAILAVLGLYRHRFRSMVDGARGRDPVGRNTLVAIVVACLPAVAAGLVLEDTIKEHLFGSWPVAVAWLVGGLAILAVARQRQGIPPTKGAPLSALDWQNALIIGVAQTFALWPGVSRSLVTIVAALAVGLSVPAAVEFAFLLGFVTLGGATAYETLSSGQDMVDAYGVAVPLLGLVVAFASALVAMRWMVGYLNRHGLEIFGWYRIAAALALAGLLVTGVV